ncbi:MAG: winged helix-turn-helix transcriptional regulator [Actinobacteria bacterium]|nr:winged helix-turn-helix transcriptional regulator [Actinomycetota bacterium]
MSRRSYGQYCGVAKALDVLGERWTLLIVRDLLPGPLRYSDLLAGLPGISTDLLADRLRAVQQCGVVERVTLPPPAASTVYQLTRYGEQLRAVIGHLARFGGRLLGPWQDTSDQINPAWAMASMAAGYTAPADDPPATYQFNFDGRTYVIETRSGQARLRRGPTPSPDVTITGPGLPILGILTGRLPLEKAIADDTITIEGSAGLLPPLIAALGQPARPTAL